MSQIVLRKKSRSLKKSPIFERTSAAPKSQGDSVQCRKSRAWAFWPSIIFAVLTLSFLAYSFELGNLMLLIAMGIVLGFLEYSLTYPRKRSRRLAHEDFRFFGSGRPITPPKTIDFNRLEIGDAPKSPEDGKNGLASKPGYVLLESSKSPHFPVFREGGMMPAVQMPNELEMPKTFDGFSA